MGCHFLLQGNLPNPGIKPTLPALEGEVSTAGQPGKALEALKLENVVLTPDF